MIWVAHNVAISTHAIHIGFVALSSCRATQLGAVLVLLRDQASCPYDVRVAFVLVFVPGIRPTWSHVSRSRAIYLPLVCAFINHDALSHPRVWTRAFPEAQILLALAADNSTVITVVVSNTLRIRAWASWIGAAVSRRTWEQAGWIDVRDRVVHRVTIWMFTHRLLFKPNLAYPSSEAGHVVPDGRKRGGILSWMHSCILLSSRR